MQSTLAPIAAMLADEISWMREQFAELPESNGTEVMRGFFDAMDAHVATLDRKLAAGPIKPGDLFEIVQQVAGRVESTRQVLEHRDEMLHFLLMAGGAVILGWCNDVNNALNAL